MARAEVPPFHNPLEGLGQKVREIPVWVGRHWKSLSLAAATLAGGGYIFITQDRGPQNPPIQPTVPAASDTFKYPDSELGIVIPDPDSSTAHYATPCKSSLGPEYTMNGEVFRDEEYYVWGPNISGSELVCNNGPYQMRVFIRKN